MFKLINPLPQALRDTSRLRNFYRDVNLVPYAGTRMATSHSFLHVLCDFYELSPSHANCINDINFWAFEGDVTVVKKSVPGLASEVGQTTEAETTAFVDLLTSVGLSLERILDLQMELYRSWKKTGNAYLMMTVVTVGGVPVIDLEVVDPLECMYLLSEPGEPETLVLSPNLAEPTYFRDGPIELVRKYPNWTTVSSNVRRTIFHVKNKRDHSKWYGRPDSLQSLYWQFVEWQYANLTAKVSSTEVTAKGLLLLQRPQPAGETAGGKSQGLNIKQIGDAIRAVTTNRGAIGKSESLGVMDYPHGVEKPELLKLDVNRDAGFLDKALTYATNYIYASNGWSKVLNGFERPSSGIGGNVLIDEFLTKNTSTIIPTQRSWEGFWGGVYREVATIANEPGLVGYCHRYQDNVSLLVQSLRGVAVETLSVMNGVRQNSGSNE